MKLLIILKFKNKRRKIITWLPAESYNGQAKGNIIKVNKGITVKIFLWKIKQDARVSILKLREVNSGITLTIIWALWSSIHLLMLKISHLWNWVYLHYRNCWYAFTITVQNWFFFNLWRKTISKIFNLCQTVVKLIVCQ
jgi:hypothetical protein